MNTDLPPNFPCICVVITFSSIILFKPIALLIPKIISGIVPLFQLEIIGLKCGKYVRRCQNNRFFFKQADSDAYLLSEIFHAPWFFSLNFIPKDAVFHGLSEASPSFLGRLYDSPRLAKILKKIVEKFTMNFCISTFSLEKKRYLGKVIDMIL